MGTFRKHFREDSQEIPSYFSPDGTKDSPVVLEDLADERTTFLEYENGSKETLVDNSREVENQKDESVRLSSSLSRPQPEKGS